MVELGLVEQRYQAVLEVLNDGVPVTEVAARFGVTRQSVHRWLKRYADRGLAGLVDGSTVPGSCPHQMAPIVEARIVEMRVEHPGWGPRTIGHWLAREGVDPVPGRSSIHPSPTPAVDPAGSTPHEPPPPRHTGTGATTSYGYRGLTTRGAQIVDLRSGLPRDPVTS